jgi:hypothetical protein
MIKRIGCSLLVLLAACASGSSSTSSASPSRAAPVRRANSNQMDTTEFRRPEFRTLYDAIKALHGDWLIPKGGVTSISAPSEPVVGVFIDGQSNGYPVSKLLEFVGGDVRSVKRISGGESLATYGPSWSWGGIVITRAR